MIVSDWLCSHITFLMKVVLIPNPRRTRPRKFCATISSLSGASRGRCLVSLSFNPKMFRSAPRQSAPRMFCSQVLKPIPGVWGFLNFFRHILNQSFFQKILCLLFTPIYSPPQKFMEGNIVQYFFHQSHSDIMISSSYHHYIRNTLVKTKLVQFSPQSIMFCPLICTSLTMFSPHVNYLKGTHEWGLFSPLLIQLYSETFS